MDPQQRLFGLVLSLFAIAFLGLRLRYGHLARRFIVSGVIYDESERPRPFQVLYLLHVALLAIFVVMAAAFVLGIQPHGRWRDLA